MPKARDRLATSHTLSYCEKLRKSRGVAALPNEPFLAVFMHDQMEGFICTGLDADVLADTLHVVAGSIMKAAGGLIFGLEPVQRESVGIILGGHGQCLTIDADG